MAEAQPRDGTMILQNMQTENMTGDRVFLRLIYALKEVTKL